MENRRLAGLLENGHFTYDAMGNMLTDIRELNSYPPFGTRIPGSIQAADNRHRFGGKEEQRYGN